MLRQLALLASIVAGLLATTETAYAKAQMDSPYSYRQTFGSVLRMVKVDLAFQVTEVNSDWGYVLFEYVSADSGARKNRAAIQLVESEATGTVQVAVQVPQMPSFHEDLVLDKLKQKLQEEHGAPPERGRKKEPDESKKKDDDKDKERRPGDEDRRGRNPDNVIILEPARDSLKKRP